LTRAQRMRINSCPQNWLLIHFGLYKSEFEFEIPALSVQWEGSPRCSVPSANSSRWPWLRGGADTCSSCCYAASACGARPRRGPPAALPGAGVWKRKNNSADVQRNRVNITGFICTVAG
jgi:hypothetical protein